MTHRAREAKRERIATIRRLVAEGWPGGTSARAPEHCEFLLGLLTELAVEAASLRLVVDVLRDRSDEVKP